MKSLPRILFCAAASNDIGLGHIMRCRTLSDELLLSGWITGFAGCGLPDNLLQPSVPNLFSFFEIANPADMPISTAKVVDDFRPDILLVDHYGFREADFLRLKRPGMLSGAIDDDASRSLPVDFVINPNPGFTPEPYEKQGIPTVLCGEKYTIIRREITMAVPPYAQRPEKVLVSVGGGNVQDLIMQIVSVPALKNRATAVSVGPACPIDRIESWVADAPDLRTITKDPRKFPELMTECTLAVTGGGTTLWEVYHLGIPAIAIVWVENQKGTTGLCAKYKTGPVIDARRQLDLNLLNRHIEKLLSDKLESMQIVINQRSLIDGQGAARIAKALRGMI